MDFLSCGFDNLSALQSLLKERASTAHTLPEIPHPRRRSERDICGAALRAETLDIDPWDQRQSTMGAGGSFEYVAKFVEEDPDLDNDEQKKLAAYVREHKITGKRAKRRFMNNKASLEEIAGKKAAKVLRSRLRQKKVQVGRKAAEFFENVKDFIAAKHEIDA